MNDTLDLHQQIPNTMPKNFCIAPFQSIRQNPYGKNSPCAFGAGEWNHGHLTTEQRWNSPELNQLRAEFIAGERPSACHRCWAEEDAGKPSLRQRQLEYFPNDYKDFIQSGDWLNGPKTAVFKTSNVCNLACRSCAGWDTNSYAKEGKHYLDTYQTTAEVNGVVKPHNRFIPLLPPKHMDFSQYYKIAHNLEKIDFFGGEPFLNITQLELLEYLVEQGLSKKITLYYSTNCTNYPTERLQRAWNNFKRVEISMSIDGIGAEFEYMRYPGKWSEAVDVINYIINLKTNLQCEVYTMAALTVSAINVWAIDPLVDWVKKTIGNYYINMVQSPAYLAVHILPESVKESIRSHVQNTEVLGYLDIAKHDSVQWNEFIIWQNRQDKYRNQEFSAVFPEYFQLLQPYWDSTKLT